jgi:glycosyltransferase involved in cell wall biosynthesis
MSVLHQFVVGAFCGDAISTQACILQKWLRAHGWQSEIYAEHIEPELAGGIMPYTCYRPGTSGEVAILHHCIGSPMLHYLLRHDFRLILIYQNITPPHFMAGASRQLSQLLQVGVNMLPQFASRTLLALSCSEYSRRDLLPAVFANTAILPVPLDEEAYRQPPDQRVLERFADDFANILFVGRIAPNKRVEGVIRVFYYYQHINHRSRLVLMGKPMSPVCPYNAWLKDLIQHMGLRDVYLTRHVPLAALLAYYELADVNVSMSEHKGYGVPLVESMYFDVPVVAYRTTAISGTLGQSGVQVAQKDYSVVSELIHQLVTNSALRESVISRQRQHLSQVRMSQVH